MIGYVEELLERMVQKGGIKSLLILLTKSIDTDAQRFAALALGNVGSAGTALQVLTHLANLLFLQHSIVPVWPAKELYRL